MTVHGVNSQQVVDTQMVELKLTPVHSGGSCSPFTIKPYVRDNLSVGTDTIEMDRVKTKYPHLDPVPLHKYSYADYDMESYGAMKQVNSRPQPTRERRPSLMKRLTTMGFGIKWVCYGLTMKVACRTTIFWLSFS